MKLNASNARVVIWRAQPGTKVWSAGHDVEFANRMQAGGLEVEVHQVTARPGGKGDRHVIFLGRKAD